MKKTLMALALTLVAGSMIACGETAPPAANNANMAKPPVANKAPEPMPATNNAAPAAGNSNMAKPAPANANAK